MTVPEGMDQQPLISIIIPAYNAVATLADTLDSVCAQTYGNLEILIVDDGSKDATVALAEECCRRDPRIRVIRQDNAGVAAARNNGWRQAQSDYIAFVDADDLWTRDKISRQFEALRGSDAGLVYSWYVIIDAANRVTYRGDGPRQSGDVLDALILNNFVGNGSAAMVRRDVLERVGGFEPALHNSGAQGCEDILFYCRVAEHYRFAVVEDYQIGYRQLPDNMSSNMPRMLRSWLMVLDELASRHPQRRALLHRGLAGYATWLARRSVHQGKPASLCQVAAVTAKWSPVLALKLIGQVAPATAFEMLRWKLPIAQPKPKVVPDTPEPAVGTLPFPVGSVFAPGVA